MDDVEIYSKIENDNDCQVIAESTMLKLKKYLSTTQTIDLYSFLNAYENNFKK